MTKKHFIKLAAVLKAHRNAIDKLKPFDYQDEIAWAEDSLVSKIADMCEEMNPKFDRKKFIAATK